MAVSYDGGAWEKAAGEFAMKLLYSQEIGNYSAGSHFTLPILNDTSKYYLTSYSWYYGSQGHTLTVSNLAVHQLVYACDYNGHNPLHVFLSEELNPSNTDDQLRSLVAAGFGSDLPIHYALKVGV